MPSYDYDRVNLIYQPQQAARRNHKDIIVRLVALFLLIGGLSLILLTLHQIKNEPNVKSPALKGASLTGQLQKQSHSVHLPLIKPENLSAGRNQNGSQVRTSSDPPPSCKITPYDYLQLTVTWPATYCITGQCVKNVTDEWGIHGLWPNYNNGEYPQFCCDEWQFDDLQIADLQPQLHVRTFFLYLTFRSFFSWLFAHFVNLQTFPDTTEKMVQFEQEQR
jgi:hypothetical protein